MRPASCFGTSSAMAAGSLLSLDDRRTGGDSPGKRRLQSMGAEYEGHDEDGKLGGVAARSSPRALFFGLRLDRRGRSFRFDFQVAVMR